MRVPSDVLRCPLCDDGAAPSSSLRAKIDNPIRGADDIEIVFDHDDGIALICETLQYLEKLVNIVKM